ncbi:endonuclease domain-containing protein, partial [Escherichia coli]|nr:endonuclease domain-containing protein [Escherichia coli]
MERRNNIHRARNLRKKSSDAENKLWQSLRARQLRGFKFRRQVPMGPYIVDFACLEAGLIIEVDGGQHAEQRRYDEARTHWLESQGLRVLRFWNHEVLLNMTDVLEHVLRSLPAEHPHP